MINLADKMDLRRGDNHLALSELSTYHTWKQISKSFKNNKFKISRTTWDGEFKFPDGSYSMSGMQDYFEEIIKKVEALDDKPPTQIYVNRIQNRIEFKMNTRYCLELLTCEAKTLHWSTERRIT